MIDVLMKLTQIRILTSFDATSQRIQLAVMFDWPAVWDSLTSRQWRSEGLLRRPGAKSKKGRRACLFFFIMHFVNLHKYQILPPLHLGARGHMPPAPRYATATRLVLAEPDPGVKEEKITFYIVGIRAACMPSHYSFFLHRPTKFTR